MASDFFDINNERPGKSSEGHLTNDPSEDQEESGVPVCGDSAPARLKIKSMHGWPQGLKTATVDRKRDNDDN